MGENKSIFQMVVLGIFIFAIVAAVLIFASLSGGNTASSMGDVTMWGTLDAEVMSNYLQTLNDTDQRAQNIFYKQIPTDQFQTRLAEALADGKGPDLVLITQASMIRNWNKLVPFSYKDISERVFKSTFIDEADMFLGRNGIIALPFSIDPIVMYWNRDLFAESGIAKPPMYWDELFGLSEKLTVRDKANNVIVGTIAFGEYDNVNHAKDILSLLTMQAGGSVVERNSEGKLYATFVPSATSGVSFNDSAQTALLFFTGFSDPVKNVYSWNRSMPNSLDAFAQGKLALYIGYASEAGLIQQKNAHLNFDVAKIPQIRTGQGKKILTFGTIYALGVPRAAKNIRGGQIAAKMLTNAAGSSLFSNVSVTPSPRRDLLNKVPKDAERAIYRDSALISRAWFDPNQEETNRIFRNMITDVTSGSLRISDAVQSAQSQLSALLRK